MHGPTCIFWANLTPFSLQWPTLYSDVARFLLVRGDFSWLGIGWEGCIDFATPLEHFDFDFGVPAELCHETTLGSRIFTRRWTNANVTVDCNTNDAAIVVAGHLIAPLPPPPLPPPPPPSPPPPPCCPKCAGPCKQCGDGKQSCPFTVPPLPPCPAGFVNHSSGYWSNPDQVRH